MLNLLNAVVSAGEVECEEECLVEISAALAGVCDAIAMLAAATRADRTAKDRRDTADLCRKNIMIASNAIAARLAAGEDLPWMLRPLGAPN